MAFENKGISPFKSAISEGCLKANWQRVNQLSCWEVNLNELSLNSYKKLISLETDPIKHLCNPEKGWQDWCIYKHGTLDFKKIPFKWRRGLGNVFYRGGVTALWIPSPPSAVLGTLGGQTGPTGRVHRCLSHSRSCVQFWALQLRSDQELLGVVQKMPQR